MRSPGGRKNAKRKVVVSASTGSRALEQSRIRLLCVGLFFLLSFLSINARLLEMMISAPHPLPQLFSNVKHAFREGQEPEDMDVVSTEQTLRRGDIVDRNGVLLATSLMTASSFANPSEINDLEAAARKLSKVVGIPQERLLSRLKGNRSFVWIKRHMTPAEQQQVNTLGIPGVYFLPEERRAYPYGRLFSHALGYVGVDNHGLAGLEKHFDRQLQDEVMGRQPLMLSLDMRVQHILRDEVTSAMKEFKAIGAAGAIANVKTGEIIALVSLPDFDPHHPGDAKPDHLFNRVSLGTYEMGSTFKTFTVALALESGTATVKDGYDATNPLRVARHTISDSHPKKRWLSVPEIYAYSSNIGTAKMLLDVGISRQKEFMSKIGMLEPIGIELPEISSPLYPQDWKEINAITISYGHGISVTPLHLIRGIATLVGGGELKPLTLLRNGNVGKARGEQVVSKETSRKVAQLMRLVVTHGTGGKADVPGYRIGGKTGTAEKISASGSYQKNSKIASFVATFPVDEPEYALLVMVDEPKGTKATYGYATGGWVAAPAVRKVVERMAPLLGVEPSFEPILDAEAEQYWVNSNPKTKPTIQVTQRKRDRGYVHAVSY